MILSDHTRAEAAARLRAAADLMAAGDVKGCGIVLLTGLGSIASELKRAYGPLAQIVVTKKVEELFK